MSDKRFTEEEVQKLLADQADNLESAFEETGDWSEARAAVGVEEPLTMDEVRDMSPEQVNARWSEVSETLAAGDIFSPEHNDDLPNELPRPGGVSGPLTMDQIRNMSESDINKNWDQVQEVMRAHNG